MADRQTRRGYLATLGAVSVAGLAGCSESETGTETGTAGTTTTADAVTETPEQTDQTTDSDQDSQSDGTSQQSGEQVTNRLQVLEASGLVTESDGDDSVGAVTLVATKAPGADHIDLTGLTMQWVDDGGVYDLAHEQVGTASVDGVFAHTAIKDEDESLGGSPPTINNGDDRVEIVIDIGSAESSGDAAAAYDTSVGDDDVIKNSGLGEGKTASIRITTASGTASAVTLTVPESLAGKEAVRL